MEADTIPKYFYRHIEQYRALLAAHITLKPLQFHCTCSLACDWLSPVSRAVLYLSIKPIDTSTQQ